MEKISSIDRVVGKMTRAEKNQILIAKEEIFDDQFFEKVGEREKEKTEEELKIINLANEATNEMRREYGLEDFDIPPENFHIIFRDVWPKKRQVAFYDAMVQAVAAKEEPRKMVFMENTLHEMMHFKSYNALQLTAEKEPRIAPYRCGLVVVGRNAKKQYFSSLNEAITAEMTKRALLKLFKNPLFAEEREQTKKIIEKYPNIRDKSGQMLFDEETYHVEQKGTKVTRNNFSYPEEREILDTLIKKIMEKNPGRFKDKKEIFEIFAKGAITGNILPMGKLIDKTFGVGALRKIGETDKKAKSLKALVASL